MNYTPKDHSMVDIMDNIHQQHVGEWMEAMAMRKRGFEHKLYTVCIRDILKSSTAFWGAFFWKNLGLSGESFSERAFSFR